MTPYYQADGQTIYHGDCREVIEQWEGLRTQSFDLLLTDPPYGIDLAAHPFRAAHASAGWDAQPVDEPTLRRIRNLCRKAIIWGGNYFGLPAHECFLLWDKGQSEDFSSAMCEQAWTNLQQPAKMYRENVWQFPKDHPTQKPLGLMMWCIGWANKPTSILDPFMGSGTTLVAAKRLGKQATGIEREERYCEIAAKRLSQRVLDFSEPQPDPQQLDFLPREA